MKYEELKKISESVVAELETFNITYEEYLTLIKLVDAEFKYKKGIIG